LTVVAHPTDPTPARAPAATRTAGRIRGLDAARALAIFGMVTVHFGPFPVRGDDLASAAYRVPYGRASVLFAFVAGVGVALLSGDGSAPRVRSAGRRLVLRAALLFPLGVALQKLPTGVAVILQYYAIYFLIAAAALRLADRWLLALAGSLTLAGPMAIVLAQRAEPSWFDAGGNVGIRAPVALLRALVISGYYPVLSWAPVVLFGIWIGRRDLHAPGVHRRLVACGAGVAAAAYGLSAALVGVVGRAAEEDGSWRQLALSDGHSEMPLAIIGATAVAVAIVGLAMLLTDWLPRVSWPLVAAGQLALTVYVAHLLVLAATPELLRAATVEQGVLSVARFVLFVVTVAALWRLRFARGPIEALFHQLTSRKG